jgi:hypothetical protein
MKTHRYYMVRIPATEWFIRCPRWFYNRWPWAGIVHIWDEPTDHVGDANKMVSKPNDQIHTPPH